MHPVFKQLDPEAIRRVREGIKHKDVPAKKLKPKRKAKSYRAAQRNEVLRGETPTTWRGITPDYRIDPSAKSKTYKPNGKRERERRQKRLVLREAA